MNPELESAYEILREWREHKNDPTRMPGIHAVVNALVRILLESREAQRAIEGSTVLEAK